MYWVGFRIRGRKVDDVQQDARALQVLEEADAEPGAVGGAFDQAGNVGDDEALGVADAHDAEVRVHRGERIVGDLRACGRNGADEGALAGVWQAEQADVGEHAQLKAKIAFFARFALRALARCAIGARLEVDVAKATLSTAGEQDRLTVGVEVGDDLAGVLVGDHRTDRNVQGDIAAALAVAIARAAVFASLREELAGVAILDQGVEVAVGDDVNAAAASAVAPVRAAFRLVLLTPERDDAVAAIASRNIDFCLVDELHETASFGKTWTTQGTTNEKALPQG